MEERARGAFVGGDKERSDYLVQPFLLVRQISGARFHRSLENVEKEVQAKPGFEIVNSDNFS